MILLIPNETLVLWRKRRRLRIRFRHVFRYVETAERGNVAGFNLLGTRSGGFDLGTYISGTLYYNASNDIVYPIGTYVLTETKAPTGYQIDGSTWKVSGEDGALPYKFIIDGDGTTRNVVTGKQYPTDTTVTQYEPTVKGGAGVQKADANNIRSQGFLPCMMVYTDRKIRSVFSFKSCFAEF